ncbi:MAG TPA: S8 family peptidase [Vicinamibacterales bacterium]|nr:S8 family peptidase [Vicinamibacterales bacterium]
MRRATIFRPAILCAAIAVSVAAAYLAVGVETSNVETSNTAARVIVQMAPGHAPPELNPVVAALGGTIGRTLDIINASVVDLPARAIPALADHPLVAHVSPDRPVAGTMERTSATIGATAIHDRLGYDGSGVGVAIIDSGVTPWHDDLASGDGGQRVVRFVDFVRNRPNPYDDYGHGTHVAGVIAGNAFDSGGARTGIAPRAHLMILKVLDDGGNGRISDVIAAFDYVLKKSAGLNIRVVNLSVATRVDESYTTDPLTVAAKQLVDAGIVVVAAAGNLGRTADSHDAYGGITAPGNAPWVLTVGASNHMGSASRADDQMALFSSRGPTLLDSLAKPDLVAPGVGIESLSAQDSTFYRTLSPYLLGGTVATGYLPYLSLTGTSMAAPVVSGTIALLLQANPALTPNAVKAILQYTAEVYSGYDPLTQGAGFLNAAGAVELARSLVTSTATNGSPSSWSRSVIWGNQLIRGDVFSTSTAWAKGVTWGDAAQTQTIVGNAPRNVVWGRRCGGDNCQEQWTIAAAYDESVVWGTNIDQSVVWGTTFGDDSVVWGTSLGGRASHRSFRLEAEVQRSTISAPVLSRR